MTDDAIVLDRTYPHTVAKVWAALTDPAALARWLMPNDFAPRLGHRFTFIVPPADRDWSGAVACEVVALDPPRHLAFTWASEPLLPETLVTWTLDAIPGGTRVRLAHTGFAAGDGRGLRVRDILAGGWPGLLDENLRAWLDATDEGEEVTDRGA